jgi:hypothetical protein
MRIRVQAGGIAWFARMADSFEPSTPITIQAWKFA